VFTPFNGGDIIWPNIIFNACVAVLIILPILLLSINALKTYHPQHVFALWYAFSFGLCAVAVALVYCGNLPAEDENDRIGYYGILLNYGDYVTNVKDEFFIVAAFVVVTVVPQILSYVLSGIFGCASSP